MPKPIKAYVLNKKDADLTRWVRASAAETESRKYMNLVHVDKGVLSASNASIIFGGPLQAASIPDDSYQVFSMETKSEKQWALIPQPCDEYDRKRIPNLLSRLIAERSTFVEFHGAIVELGYQIVRHKDCPYLNLFFLCDAINGFGSLSVYVDFGNYVDEPVVLKSDSVNAKSRYAVIMPLKVK